PRVVLEAMARGTPVVCSDLGAMREMVPEGQAGLRFIAGDAADLASKVRRLQEEPGLSRGLRRPTRRLYLRRFTAERNYELLIAIYREALAASCGRQAIAASF